MKSVSTYQAYKLWLQGGLSSCGSPCTMLSTTKRFTNAIGAPVADNTNIMTAGPRSPALLQDIWLIETYKGLPHGMCTTEPEVINPDLLAFINEAVLGPDRSTMPWTSGRPTPRSCSSIRKTTC